MHVESRVCLSLLTDNWGSKLPAETHAKVPGDGGGVGLEQNLNLVQSEELYKRLSLSEYV